MLLKLNQIKIVVAYSWTLARAMGQAGRQRVERLFTIRHTAAKMELVYNALFARRRPKAADPLSRAPAATEIL